MCGSLRLNEVNPGVAEIVRPGNQATVTLYNDGSTQHGKWDGFARKETLAKTWLTKGWKPALIEGVKTFTEWGSVKGTKYTGKNVTFPVPQGKGLASIYKDGQVKIVTRQAQGKEMEVHHRMPVIASKKVE